MKGVKYVSMEGGYGVAAERTVAALAAAGVPVTWAPMQRGRGWGGHLEPSTRRDLGPPALRALCNRPLDYEAVIVHTVPEYFPRWAERERGRRILGYTTWETDRLPPAWPALLRRVDALAVPCAWNAEVFARDTGVRPAVIPHPCDPAPLPAVPRSTDEFCFLVVGTWLERKGLADTVTAFCRAFTRRDRVRLIVKTSRHIPVGRRWPWSLRGRPGRAVRRLFGEGRRAVAPAVARIRRGFPDAPPVELVTDTLSDDGMRALLARSDAYVALCRGEGWGLGAFDAAAHGRPVAMTGFGGPLDYLDPRRAWLIDYDLESCAVAEEELQGSYRPEQRWARPRFDHAVACLRAIREQPEEARRKALDLARDIRMRFAPAAVAERWRDVLTSRAGAH